MIIILKPDLHGPQFYTVTIYINGRNCFDEQVRSPRAVSKAMLVNRTSSTFRRQAGKKRFEVSGEILRCNKILTVLYQTVMRQFFVPLRNCAFFVVLMQKFYSQLVRVLPAANCRSRKPNFLAFLRRKFRGLHHDNCYQCVDQIDPT